MNLKRWRGKRALVTGASAGIGKAFAEELAAAGVHLVLTARREDRLAELAILLRSAHEVEVDWVAVDLGEPQGPAAIYEFTNNKNLRVDILINNAGFGSAGQFVEISGDKALSMIQLNIAALVTLSHLYLPGMMREKSGHIILVGSVNAFMPVPHFAVYSATKAFVRSFGEALALECRSRQVYVSTVHPGATATEFVDVAQMKLKAFMYKGLMPSRAVARRALSASYNKQISTVTGILNKLTVFFLWLLPQRLVRWGAKTLFSRLH